MTDISNRGSIDAQIVKRQDRSKGFGFVTVKNEDDVTKAVEALHHTELQGRQINVESAKALTERPPRQPKVKTEDKQPSEPREPGDKPRRKRKPKKKPSAQQVRLHHTRDCIYLNKIH